MSCFPAAKQRRRPRLLSMLPPQGPCPFGQPRQATLGSPFRREHSSRLACLRCTSASSRCSASCSDARWTNAPKSSCKYRHKPKITEERDFEPVQVKLYYCVTSLQEEIFYNVVQVNCSTTLEQRLVKILLDGINFTWYLLTCLFQRFIIVFSPELRSTMSSSLFLV